MKVLILGGRRYLGPRLVKTLLEHGHEPLLFNRGLTRAPLPVQSPIREIHGDRNNRADLESLVKQERFDAVVDCLAFSREHAELAVSVFSGHIGRYLVISSVACYGRLRHVPADEHHPYIDQTNTFPGDGGSYGEGKRDIELAFLHAYQQAKFPVIIIRPSVSYGYARLFNVWGYSNRHVSRIRLGKPVIVPDTGESLIQPVHIDDEAEIVTRALETDAAIGQAINCAGPVPVPLWQYFMAHGTAMNCKAEFKEIPAAFLFGFDPVLAARSYYNLIYNHAYDVGKLTSLLGFKHKYSLEAGLEHTIDFMDRHGLTESTHENDPDDWIINAYERCHSNVMQRLGNQLRQEKGYRPPETSPLLTWLPTTMGI
ncbi:MAG: NAD-dependent epimerase/dehydratase family protein [Phycisphaeraceae bacterium]|nr:NAD-dependent epimerase/dehydratase family protein [Phycisphaeraceae bacterium]